MSDTTGITLVAEIDRLERELRRWLSPPAFQVGNYQPPAKSKEGGNRAERRAEAARKRRHD